MFLYRHPGSSLSSLAEHLGVTKPTASTICERLVQRSFIDRREHPKERRTVELKLTEAGDDRLQEIRQKTRAKIAGMLGNLSEEQLLCVMEGLAVLSGVFAEEMADGLGH